MSREDAASPSSGFPMPDFDAWQRRVEREIDRPYSKIFWEPDAELRIPPVGLKNTQTRGAATQLLEPPWRREIRQWIDDATPAQAAQTARQALDGGAEGLFVRFDSLARQGFDPATLDESAAERELFDFDAGNDGCAIYGLTDLDAALRDIDLGTTPLAFDAGAASLPCLGMLLALADRRSVARNRLRAEVGLDPMGELVVGRPRGASRPGLLDELHRGLDLCEESPGIVPIAANSSVFHEAGASTALELACTLATAIEYLRHLVTGDAQVEISRALRSVCVRISVNTEIYLEIAKLRAARLLWAKIAHAFGGTDLRATIHVTSSPRSFSSDDVYSNLLRTAIQAFAATLGGADSLALRPFAQSHDDRDSVAHALARNQQLLCRHESHLDSVLDPCAGSNTIEQLTDELAERAWRRVQEIEGRGGMLTALETGAIQREIRSHREARRETFRRRQRCLVGTTRFIDPKIDIGMNSTPDYGSILATHRSNLSRRNHERVATALSETPVNLVTAADAGCSSAEILQRIRGERDLGCDEELPAFASDAAEFEALRELVRIEDLRALPLRFGTTQVGRAREALARDELLAGGFVVLPPLDLTESVDIEQHAPDVVVFCADDAGNDRLADQVRGEFLRIATGPPRPNLTTTVDGFLAAGGDTYSTLRGIFLRLGSDQFDPDSDPADSGAEEGNP